MHKCYICGAESLNGRKIKTKTYEERYSKLRKKWVSRGRRKTLFICADCEMIGRILILDRRRIRVV